MSGPDDRPEPSVILAIDSATTRIVVALGTLTGNPIETTEWPAGYRHGETLLPAVDTLLRRLSIARQRLAAIVVGTGPGAFTGLRVGIATAKGLDHALGVPIVGISTADALLEGAPDGALLLLPAGPTDRLVAGRGRPAALVTSTDEPAVRPSDHLVAVDLSGRAPLDALERGEAARARLGVALLELGAARLAAGDVDDLARLVPDYVTLPRGVRTVDGEVAWSRDPR